MLHDDDRVRLRASPDRDDARYVTSINDYLIPHLGRVQLRQLRPDQLTALYRHLAADGGRKGRPLAAKTILNLHQLLRLALADAAELRDGSGR